VILSLLVTSKKPLKTVVFPVNRKAVLYNFTQSADRYSYFTN